MVFLRRIHIAFASLILCGCARSNVSTSVNADGSFTRTVKLTGQAPAKEGELNFSPGSKLEDVFLAPSGPAWKVTKSQKDQDLTITAIRTVAARDVLKDIIIKSKKAPMGRQVVNEVTVRKIGPGRMEYREVLHWQGDKGQDFAKALPEVTSMLKKSLPTALATDANATALAQPIMKEFWRLLFGPGDPLILQLMLHPDLVERRMRQRVGKMTNSILVEKFGDKLSSTERAATVQKLIAAFMAAGETASKSKSDSPPGKDSDDSALVAMLFSVKLPGKVIATNGELDDSSGEVFWALYSQAAALEDVVMTATCEIGK